MWYKHILLYRTLTETKLYNKTQNTIIKICDKRTYRYINSVKSANKANCKGESEMRGQEDDFNRN